MDHIQLIAYGAIGVGAILLAVAMGLFVSARHRASRDRLELDLFAKRWRVYATVANTMDTIISNQDLALGDHQEFHHGIAGHEFLFRSDVIEFIEEMARRFDEIRSGTPDTDPAAKKNALEWCHAKKGMLRPLFGRYMDLSKQ